MLLCTHRQSVDGSYFLPDGEHVQQGLSGVFSYSITTVQDRTAAEPGSLLQHR